MLDIRYIKENPQEVIERLAAKGKEAEYEINEILRLDGERRALILETDSAKAEQNKVSKQIPMLK
ncbi:MAG: serine--tRNA ligase, partial [Clostridia bacterium]|nr:serine--tRNA ligase [Clostridia bacterium]